MTFSYFPGCTLKTKAKDLDRCAPRLSAEALGVHAGGAAGLAVLRRGVSHGEGRDRHASSPPSARWPRRATWIRTLVTLCSACHNVIKRVNRDMQRDEDIRTKRQQLPRSWTTPYTRRDHGPALSGDAARRGGLRPAGKARSTNPLNGQEDRRLLRLPAAAPQQGHGASTTRKTPRSSRTSSAPSAPTPVVYRHAQRVLRRLCDAGGPRLAAAEERRTRHGQRRGLRRGDARHRMSAVHVQPEQERARRPCRSITSPSCWPRRWA